jgi:hypothetical protein
MKTKLWDFSEGLSRTADGGGAPPPSGGASGGSDLAAAAAKVVENAGGAGAGAAGGDGKPAGAPPAAYLPDGLPEQFRGQTDKETIDKLLGDYAGRPKAPEKADDYKFAPSEDFTKKWGNLKDDKVLAGWRGVAHELGLSDAQFNQSIERFYGMLEKSGLHQPAPDPKDVMLALAPPTGDDVSRQSAGARRIMDAEAFVNGLEAKGLPKEGAMRLIGLIDDAEGVKTIEFIQRLINVPGVQPGGQAGPSQGGTPLEKATRAMYPSMFKS